jgi:hypothetical protein
MKKFVREMSKLFFEFHFLSKPRQKLAHRRHFLRYIGSGTKQLKTVTTYIARIIHFYSRIKKNTLIKNQTHEMLFSLQG